MRVAYVTTYDASDPHAWSGSASYIPRALRSSAIETEVIDKVDEGPVLACLLRAKALAYRRLLRRDYQRDRSPTVARRYARRVQRRLEGAHCDAVLSPGTLPVSCLDTDRPIAIWTDATFDGMVGFYPGFSNFCAETLRDGHRLEQQALSRCRLAIFSSEWAAATALRHYDVDAAKVKVVPFGANLDCRRTSQDIERIVLGKDYRVCRLLLVGVDWTRKGGETALAVAQCLNRRGLPTELHVVGCRPPYEPPSFVKLHGFVPKTTEQGRRRFERLMSEAHFLLLPSTAECYGVVLAEASSFGLPSLATRVGGIPTAVRDRRNGMTFELEADPLEWCDYIERVFQSAPHYGALARGAYREYAERLNWRSAGEQVKQLLHSHCV
ncbi:glycosyltransferase family 4 protein [Cupriavidus gilardii]|uniref:glycosyltransferase family 4 protein n=1 Tax=Cupriavidus gilardii TaxID=82541 RepID=UPI0006B2EE87|nr:glycosyltransferase family 4 protein [Cupriavidus gilardii]MCT9014919.1 glycosyltransferase family 4 protein [Cupriavidus gilardii]MCT9053331.1 glycosyltransferase family 4 protein [Cupriavidus gilardii]MCT9069864.1 glycosyltransferase family 4 protein [Cupriavidus gilardii]MCT9117637.1 glycosyltransferase family 4 protein [Cupriavidus gilardii]MCT9126895.1 glycosyltransferase family 4 protein [Cupriavidus gilardii]